MKKLSTIVIFLCICIFSGYAQGNLMQQQIQQARNSGEKFESVSAFTSISRNALQNNRIQEQFVNSQEVYLLRYEQSATRIFGSFMTLQIPLGRRTMQLELEEVEMDYVVETSCGQILPPNKNIRSYQGVVKGEPNSLVAITFGEDELIGLVATNEGNFNIAFDQQLGEHIFFNDRNVVQQFGFTCGTSSDEPFEGYCPDVLLGVSNITPSTKSSTTSSTTPNTKIVRLFFETTTDIYDARGKNAGSVETFVVGLYNQVATLYRNEGIYTRFSALRIWTSNDPYRPRILGLGIDQNVDAYLKEFQSERTSFDGDLGQLLTFRNIGGGKAAGFSGLCNSNVGQRLSVAQIENLNPPNFPIYSWSTFVIAHEFGHLFGSRHTHACVWNGNNTAIDGCAGGTEGGCFTPAIPSNGGTVMSYCHWQNVGINFNLGFGDQPGNVIRHSVSQANCLNTFIVGSSVICGTGTYSLALPYSNLQAYWDVTSGFTITSPSPLWLASSTATVVADGLHGQTGTLTAWVLGLADPVITKTIHACSSCINGTPYCTGWCTLCDPPLICVNGTPYCTGQCRLCKPPPVCTCIHGQCTCILDPEPIWPSPPYPNPVSDVLTIDIDEFTFENTSQTQAEMTYDIRMYDSRGSLVRRQIIKRGKVEFDVSKLAEGVYFLHIYDGVNEKPSKEQIIVKRK
jgi:hypothetical protein